MIIKILLGLVAVVLAILVIAAFQPATFRVERSTEIAASPAAIFAEVNDLHRWQAWSPWEKKDPAMQRSFAGPAAGVGAGYGWSGNKDVGSGKMTITESQPAERVGIKIEFFTPMAGVCQATLTFAPANGTTRVSWVMTGTNSYPAKIFCLFMNMDKMIGGDFEQGLAQLKNLTEKK